MASVNTENEFGSCRCCLKNGYHRNMTKVYENNGMHEIYYNMISDCFNLFVSTNVGVPALICLWCVEQLQQASSFRKLIIDSEKKLQTSLDFKHTVFVNEPPLQDQKQCQNIKVDPSIVKVEITELDNEHCYEHEDFWATDNRHNTAVTKNEGESAAGRSLANNRPNSQKSRAKSRAHAASHQERINQVTPEQLDAASHQERINQVTPEQLAANLVAAAASQHQDIVIKNEGKNPASKNRRLANDGPKSKKSRAKSRASDAATHQERINQMIPKQLDANLDAHAAFQQQDIDIKVEDVDPVARKRRLASEAKKRWRAKQSEELRARIRALDAARYRRRVSQMTPEQLEALHAANAASQRKRIQRMTPEQLAAYHASQAAAQRRYIERLNSQRRLTPV